MVRTMARNNVSRVRYKLHILYECEHEYTGTFSKLRHEGEQGFCVECEKPREMLVIESEVYTLGTGW